MILIVWLIGGLSFCGLFSVDTRICKNRPTSMKKYVNSSTNLNSELNLIYVANSIFMFNFNLLTDYRE